MPGNPLNIPILTRPTPEVQDVLFYEDIDPGNEPYVALPYGSEHPDTANYAGYKLCKEESLNKDRSRRWWATEFVNQDIYNAGITFDAEDNSKPIYPRRYIVRRDKYNATIGPITKGTALTGVWMVKVVLGGSGYNPSVPPAVTFSGGTGSGTTARAVVNNTGSVCWIVLTSEGSGYTSAAPSVSIAAPTSGVTATATAYIQASAAILVQEKMTPLPSDDARASIFVQVDRLYETIPGATLTSSKVGEQGAIETSTSTKRLMGTSTIAGGYLVLENAARAISTVIESHERTVIDAWPILTEYDQHPELKSLITTTYEVVDASAVSAPTAVNNVITKYHKIDKFKSLKVVTTYATPATYDEQRFMAYNFATALRAFSWTEGCGTIIDAQWGQSVMVQARTEISYTTTKQTITGLFVFTNTFRIGTFNLSDILNDADTLTFTGTCVGTLILPASIPSATNYLALFNGTEQLISGESVRSGLAGLWRNSKLYVTFPDLT